MLLVIPNLYLEKWLFGDEKEGKKHTITLCLFEFLSSCCLSYSCYIDWCPYEPGYCLTSPPTFAQIRKINKITAATPALPCTNNTLLTLQHPAPNFHILHLAFEEEKKKSGFKNSCLRGGRGRHGQCKHASQFKYGTSIWWVHTFLFFLVLMSSVKQTGWVWQLLAFSVFLWQQPPLCRITTDPDGQLLRHLRLPFSHGRNPGGVSEIWRLLNRLRELGLVVMMVQRFWDVVAEDMEADGGFTGGFEHDVFSVQLIRSGGVLRGCVGWWSQMYFYSQWWKKRSEYLLYKCCIQSNFLSNGAAVSSSKMSLKYQEY